MRPIFILQEETLNGIFVMVDDIFRYLENTIERRIKKAFGYLEEWISKYTYHVLNTETPEIEKLYKELEYDLRRQEWDFLVFLNKSALVKKEEHYYGYAYKRIVNGKVEFSRKAKGCFIAAKGLTEGELRNITLHELGHYFGLKECDNPFCVMGPLFLNVDKDEILEAYCEKDHRLLIENMLRLYK